MVSSVIPVLGELVLIENKFYLMIDQELSFIMFNLRAVGACDKILQSYVTSK